MMPLFVEAFGVALVGFLAGLILAFLSYWLLRGVATRRMEQ